MNRPTKLATQSPSEIMGSRPLTDYSAQQRDAVVNACRKFEAVFKTNSKGELAVHVPAFRSALADHCSTSFTDMVINKMGSLANAPRLLTEGTLSNDWTQADWATVHKAAGFMDSSSVLQDFGISSPDAKPAEWEKALTSKIPGFNAQTIQKMKATMNSDVQKDTTGQEWWLCMQRHEDWWTLAATLGVIGLAAILSISPAGVFVWGLFFVLAAIGVGTIQLGWVIHCLENPYG